MNNAELLRDREPLVAEEFIQSQSLPISWSGRCKNNESFCTVNRVFTGFNYSGKRKSLTLIQNTDLGKERKNAIE